MALDINTLRAAFKKQESTGDSENSGFWDKFYPFYKMDFEETAEFRFLPDQDEENPLGFIVENRYHEFVINGKKKRIACAMMYDDSCICCDHSRNYYDSGDEKLGKSFWRRTDYIAQGLIITTPFEYPIKSDENPVRMISLGPKLYKVIESKIVKGDMDDMPYDMVNGYNFRINKTHQGEWADYTTSDFARKSTAIPNKMLENIDLYDLNKFRYGHIEKDQMNAMIEAFLTGQSYEEEKKDVDKNSNNSSSTLFSKEQQSAESVVNAMKDPQVDAPQTSTQKLSPQEILKKLKERQSSGQ